MMKTLFRKTVIAAVNGVLVLGTTMTGTAGASVQTAAAVPIRCESQSSGKNASFYDGKSASYQYDRKFTKGPVIPKRELDRDTPQGAATWSNWDGSKDLLLVASYGNKGQNAHILGIDPSSGKTVGTVAIAESHVGGITVAKGWAFVQGRNTGKWETIRKYRLSSLKAAMKKSGVPYLRQTGKARNVYGADFMSSYGGYLFSGKFNDKSRSRMYAYTIHNDGSLTTHTPSWEVPTKTQGLLVTGKHLIYSTSWGRDKRSNIYVVKRPGTDLDRASLYCFRAPSMTEGITAQGGKAYLVFESASHVYRGDPKTRNVIPRLHKATASSLTSLAN